MLWRILDRIDAAAAGLAWLAAVGMFVLVLAEVVARMLDTTTVISVEYGGYLMATLVFLGLGEVTRRGEHISADFLVGRMTPRARLGVECLVSGALTLVYVGMLLWFSSQLAWRSLAGDLRSQDVSMTPLVYPQSVLIVGLAVMLLRVLFRMAQQARALARSVPAERDERIPPDSRGTA